MIEEEITESILKIASKTGMYGASRDDILRAMDGVAYSELEKLAQEMEQKGYITLEWVGVCDFVMTVTPKGKELLANT